MSEGTFSMSSATLETDFNEVDADGLLLAELRLGGSIPDSDEETVLLADTEGNLCRGRIVRVDDPIFFVEPIWDTWMAADHFDITSSPREALIQPASVPTLALAG